MGSTVTISLRRSDIVNSVQTIIEKDVARKTRVDTTRWKMLYEIFTNHSPQILMKLDISAEGM